MNTEHERYDAYVVRAVLANCECDPMTFEGWKAQENKRNNKYSYGHPNSPREDDPRYQTEEAAIEAAVKHQIESPWDSVLAVWEDESGEVLALVFGSWVYRPD